MGDLRGAFRSLIIKTVISTSSEEKEKSSYVNYVGATGILMKKKKKAQYRVEDVISFYFYRFGM